MAGIADRGAAAIVKLCHGHPLARRLAIEAHLAAGSLPPTESMQRLVHALAGSFRAGLDEPVRRALDAAAVPRPINCCVLSAMAAPSSPHGETSLWPSSGSTPCSARRRDIGSF